MAFQEETGINNAADYRDLLVKMVTMATSQHVATVAVNAGGSGYVVGDIITLPFAKTLLEAKFEVTTVGGGGAITGLKINSSGAYSNRVDAVAVNAGGTGYAVGDIVEIQGGTSREKAKAIVDTEASGVVTGVSVFENGGAYSVAPGLTGAATIGIGPSTYAGDDGLTLDLTMTGLIGTTGLATAGGTGTAATVNITLAESGWSTLRNTNRRVENALTDEKEVVLIGDAAGSTNKPIIGYISWTRTAGPNTRYGIACFGMVAHNPATEMRQQVGISFGINPSTGALELGAHILCDEDQVQTMDFWMSVDDQRIYLEHNNNSSAVNTDNGEYLNHYNGFMNRYGTELENPYPMLCGAAGLDLNIDPSAASVLISCAPECAAPTAPTSSGWFYYEAENSIWKGVTNSNNLIEAEETQIMYPFGHLSAINDTSSPDFIVFDGVIDTFNSWSTVTRGAPTRVLYPVPGTQPEHLLWPLNIIQRNGGGTTNAIEDGPRGELRGIYWLTGTNSSGAKIVNFAEDLITVGGDEYKVFHNHVHSSQRYQYRCVLRDV